MDKAQIKSYSITPTTLKEIHFKLQDSEKKEIANIQKDTILQFIENTFAFYSPLLELKDNAKTPLKFFVDIQKDLWFRNLEEDFINFQKNLKETESSILFFKEKYEYQGNKVERFAIHPSNIKKDMMDQKIDTVKTNKTAKTFNPDTQTNPLHPLEIFLIQNAISSLSNNKSVLVDIFARDKIGKIQYKNDAPENHAIVLYKNSPDHIYCH